MEENRFKLLSDELYELYTALKESGFNPDQAFEMAKTYCSVAFVSQAFQTRDNYYNRQHSRREIIDRMKKNVEETKAKEVPNEQM